MVGMCTTSLCFAMLHVGKEGKIYAWKKPGGIFVEERESEETKAVNYQSKFL